MCYSDRPRSESGSHENAHIEERRYSESDDNYETMSMK